MTGTTIAPEGADRDLQGIAREVAGHYAAIPGVSAVLLCGSVARGWADGWSDIELLVCGDAVPSLEVREQLARELGATGHRVFPSKEGAEEELAIEGVKLDLAFMTMPTVRGIIEDVTVRADPSPRKHAMVAGIRDAIVLQGGPEVGRWQEQAGTYPEALRTELIRRNLVFGPQWWLAMLVARDDVLALHVLLGRVGQALVAIGLALNRTYAVSDNGKWAMRQVAGLAVAPDRFAERLRWMLQAEPRVAVAEAGELVAEMIDLVRMHAPEVAVDQVARRVASKRAGDRSGDA
jgi:predicted nucleotidyltransferase